MKNRLQIRALEDTSCNAVWGRLPIPGRKPNVRISTWEEYQRQTKNHFHELDGIKVNRITIATIEQFITNRQKEGMNINTLRRILVTLDIYAHLLKPANPESACKLENTIFGTTGSKMVAKSDEGAEAQIEQGKN